jgi:hypothetical protein
MIWVRGIPTSKPIRNEVDSKARKGCHLPTAIKAINIQMAISKMMLMGNNKVTNYVINVQQKQ